MRLPVLPMVFGMSEWRTSTTVRRTEQSARRMPRRQIPGSEVSFRRMARKRETGCGPAPAFSVSALYACTIALVLTALPYTSPRLPTLGDG